MTAAINQARPAVAPISLPRLRAPNGIAFHRAGRGAPVVLLHGVGLAAESWGAQIDALKADFTVYAADLPGHGGSAALDREDGDIADYSDRIGAFIDQVVGAPVLLAGHSMGAMIALDLAASAPGLCRGVAALGAVYRRSPQAARAVRARADDIGTDPGADIASGPVRRWFGDTPVGNDREMAAHCRHWLSQMDRRAYGTAYAAFAGGDAPPDAALRALGMPALFLAGEDDANSSPAMARAMAGLAPLGQAEIIPGAGHMAGLSHGAEVSAALALFFNRIGV